MISRTILVGALAMLASSAIAATEAAPTDAKLPLCIGGQVEINGACAMPIKNGLDESEKCIYNGTLGMNDKGLFTCQNGAWNLVAPAPEAVDSKSN